MVNKRGQGLSINALILIVLGIFILVTLIAGFTLGWSQLKSYLGFSGSNVDTIAQQCKTACDLEQQYAFCGQNRTLKVDGQELAPNSCYILARDPRYDQFLVGDCSSLKCRVQCGAYTDFNGNVAVEKPSCVPNTEQTVSSDLIITSDGMKCCIAK